MIDKHYDYNPYMRPYLGQEVVPNETQITALKQKAKMRARKCKPRCRECVAWHPDRYVDEQAYWCHAAYDWTWKYAGETHPFDDRPDTESFHEQKARLKLEAAHNETMQRLREPTPDDPSARP